MAKGKPGLKRGSATKRRRCVVCRKIGHKFEGCWLLNKGNNMEEAVVHTLPIAEMDDTQTTTKERMGLFSVHIRILVVFKLN